MSTSSVSSTSSSTNSGLLADQLINESGGLTSGSTLTNAGAGGTLQLTGLASGINTTELIQAELAEKEQPLQNMQAEISGLNNENSSLNDIQTALQQVSQDALILGEPSTFFPVQNINSSDPSLISAATSAGIGVVIGSTSMTVTSLASASQTAFTYAAGTGTGQNTLSITVGTNGTPVTTTIQVADNATADDIAEAVNGAGNLGVWATVNAAGQLILSSQGTGTGNEVSATLTPGGGSTATLSQSGTPQDGADAVINILNSDGTITTVDSPTDNATNVIPGVTLSLTGITGNTTTANPITITSAAPGPNITAIISQVEQFVTDYNSVLSGIQGATNTAPASEQTPTSFDPYSGSLFGDDQLENLTSDMRTAMYQDYSGTTIATTMTSLQQIGITGGAPTAAPTSNDETGQLTLNVGALTSALQTNPNGVQALITAWSQNLQTIVNAAASPAGSLESRIQGNSTIVTNLSSQLTSQEAMFNTEEANMEKQWATVEATLENLDSQKSSLSSFASSLTNTTSSSG